jgi:hypothetical protein
MLLRAALWLIFVSTPLFAQNVIFTHVNVIPMDSERILTDYAVVVENGRIAAVTPVSDTRAPLRARVIDGTGKFLLPGLADMHTHVDRAEMLPMFLAAGVTSTLNMGLASPTFITSTRQQVARSQLPGPQVFVAFMIDGPGDPGPQFVPSCEADARAAVGRARLLGYDFIKVYSRLQPDMYAAVLDEAHKQNIAVVGHIPNAVGFEKSLAAGQIMIAHGEEIYKTFFGDKPDTSLIPRAVTLTKDSGAYVTPTLSSFASLTSRIADPNVARRQLNAAEAHYVPPDIRGGWVTRSSQGSARFVPEYHLIQQLTLALAQANVPLLTGTDTPTLGMVPGFSLHEDLAELVRAGLTPYQALSAATRTPGEFMQKFVPQTEHFGIIAVGNRADLVLLAQNPLHNIDAVRHPVGVMTAGKWYPAAVLLHMIQKPVPEYERVITLEERFQQRVSSSGPTAAIGWYRAQPGHAKLTENFLNSLGYRLLSDKKLDAAIAIFSLNTELYPDSWNAYDSLAEACADSGNNELAVVNYRHSLALNPRNYGAQKVLQQAHH